MKLTTKGRYAVTAMLDLALHNDSGPVTLNDIAGRQKLSLSYLEQLFARLRRNGLVKSTRGPGGGYSLSRNAEEIAIVDVISAVDEKVDNTQCGGSSDCHNQKKCLTHDLWCDLSDQIKQFLAGISLGDLMQRKAVIDVATRQDKLAEIQVSAQN